MRSIHPIELELLLDPRIKVERIKSIKLKLDPMITLITISISQELLLLLNLFLFYNALLLKKLYNKNIVICDFINNIIPLIKEDNIKVNCKQLIEIYKNIYKK